jgi:hypothetical protein
VQAHEIGPLKTVTRSDLTIAGAGFCRRTSLSRHVSGVRKRIIEEAIRHF